MGKVRDALIECFEAGSIGVHGKTTDELAKEILNRIRTGGIFFSRCVKSACIQVGLNQDLGELREYLLSEEGLEE